MYLKIKKDTENKYRRSNIELTVDSEGENKENPGRKKNATTKLSSSEGHTSLYRKGPLSDKHRV